MKSKNKGIYKKYNVSRVDGKPMGLCIVLELKNETSRVVLWQYAAIAEAVGHKAFAKELRAVLTGYATGEVP